MPELNLYPNPEEERRPLCLILGNIFRTRTREVSDNYTKEQINDLFELGRFTPVLFYKAKAKKLFDLKLSFEDSKYLLQEMRLSVDEIVNCINNVKLDIGLIRKLNCSKEILLSEIPGIISTVGDIERFRTLINKNLSIEDIKTLFRQLCLTYNDVISLSECGYEVTSISSLRRNNYTCEELITLAKIISAPSVFSLFLEDNQNLKFLLTIRNILNKNITNCDSALKCYNELYDVIPNKLCNSFLEFTEKLIKRATNAGGNNREEDPTISYEDIMVFHMDLASGGISIITEIKDAIPKVFIFVEKIIKHFKPEYSKLVEEEGSSPIKPIVLASIWLSLDITLARKYYSDIETIDLKTITKTILSFIISSMCGATGYFHSGGIGLPFPNITSYIGTYFNVQKTIEKHAPKIYSKLPHCLKFDSPKEFDKLVKEKQINARRGLYMTYTYRVGNAFLCNILGTSSFTTETANNIFKSLWPLPQESESIRMYFIYSGIPIYSRLPLEKVFVTINKTPHYE